MSKMGQALIEAMQELVDHSAGRIDLRTSHISISPVRDTISAEEIKSIRKELGMSQSIFATVIGVSKRTVESWENGRYSPDGAARRLLSVIQQDPGFPERYNILHRG